MIRIFLALILTLTSAAAQAQMSRPQAPPPHDPAQPEQPHQVQALQLMYQRELQAHQADLATALQIQEKLADAQAQIAELKKSTAVTPPPNEAGTKAP